MGENNNKEHAIPHDKFITRWAEIYCNKLIKQGSLEAKKWAERFLDRESIPRVAEKVKEILKKRGFKVKE